MAVISGMDHDLAVLANRVVIPASAIPAYAGTVITPVNLFLPPPPIPESGMYVWQRSIVDASGNILADARVEVRRAEDNVLADLFSDREGNTPKSNPFFVDEEGFARFYADRGLYNIRAFRSGIERIFENVLLGIRLADLPDLTPVVQPIVEDLVAPEIEELTELVETFATEIARFTVSAAGAASGAPSGWSAERIGVGRYRINHNILSAAYTVQLTYTDNSTDRVGSAMLRAGTKGTTSFEYQTRSIHDEASANDAAVEVVVLRAPS